MKWTSPFAPIRPLARSERKYMLAVGFRMGPGTCAFCGGVKIDCCYNCEKPVCGEHANLFVFMAHRDGRPMIIFAICPECVKDNGMEAGLRRG